MQRHGFTAGNGPITGFSSVARLLLGSGAACLLALAMQPLRAQPSALLDQVKLNPGRGKALCQQLRQFNRQGTSFTAQQVTAQVARQQNISQPDAEILLTYVVGLYCPDVT